MTARGATPSIEEVRSSFDHPVIDVDGHVQEHLPAVEPYLEAALGPRDWDRYRRAVRPVAAFGHHDDLERRRRVVAPYPWPMERIRSVADSTEHARD